MFFHDCCCCLKTETVLSIETTSSHQDGKTLLDYFNCIFGASLREQPSSNFICKRCSKALQVAYHFINMVNKSREFNADALQSTKIKEESLEKSSYDGMQEKQEILLSELLHENELKHETSKEIVMSDAPAENLKKFLPSGLSKGTDGSSTSEEKYNIHNSNFICNICNITFKDKSSFVEHNGQNHKEIKPYKCKLCSYYTCYTESILKHCEKKHGLYNVVLDLYENKEVTKIADQCPEFEISYQCISCNFKDSNQEVTEEHLFNEHSIDDNDDIELFVKKCFSCPACHRSFTTPKSAKIHFSMRHICSFKKTNVCKKRKFCCEKCGDLFDLKSALFLHRRACDQRESVNCNFCSLEFNSILKYEKHLQTTHFVAIKHQCETCNKTFKCSEYLTVHRKRHNERNYQCDLCSKNYISNAELKVHKQRIHEIKYNNISCGVCKKRFANLTLLKYHENKMHTACLLQCDLCNFVSYSSSALKIHQYKHTGKPYKCHLCKKAFVFRFLLQQHLKTHHSISFNNEDMADIFKKAFGYNSRHDAFSEENNSLEITEINEKELETEIDEYGLTLEDIMDDLFHRE